MKKKTQKLVVWIIIAVMLGSILFGVVGSLITGLYFG